MKIKNTADRIIFRRKDKKSNTSEIWINENTEDITFSVTGGGYTPTVVSFSIEDLMCLYEFLHRKLTEDEEK